MLISLHLNSLRPDIWFEVIYEYAYVQAWNPSEIFGQAIVNVINLKIVQDTQLLRGKFWMDNNCGN